MSDGLFDKTYLSFGGGVQSTAMLMLALKGLHGVPRPDAVIYADTQAELKSTDRHVDHIRGIVEEAGILFLKPTAGNLERIILGLETSREGAFRASIPLFTKNTDGSIGQLKRQCTREFKVDLITKHVRLELLALKPGQRAKGRFNVRALIGISLDEITRMKPSREPWIKNCHPLIDASITRDRCITLLRKHDWPIPYKSACVFCPYHDDAYWKKLKTEQPQEFERAVAADEAVRNSTRYGVNAPVFLHRSCQPLKDVVFKPRPRRIQSIIWDNFTEECEGMCGV